ncbi:MAG: hypothetical protein PQJ59_09900 [Spirochaetales bacterium]|nr:hypothetical protein [Spirochaetales bacterium]
MNNNEKEVTITGTLTFDNDTYEYGETIYGTISIEEYDIDDLSLEFMINGSDLAVDIDSNGDFELSLTPDVNTNYEIIAIVSYGSVEEVFTYDFIVKQIPFLGTWRAYSETSPPYTSDYYDIIGIWYIDGFELYYVDQNNNDSLLSYSAKGSMSFPSENTTITLTEEYYYDESTNQWLDWTLTEGIMYAQYIFTEGVIKMEVTLDTNGTSTPEVFTWEFSKISDSIDPIY